jgi:hypothetical protein
MDRKAFLKRLTAAAIGIVVAKPIIDALPTWAESTEFVITFDKPWGPNPMTLEQFIRKYPLTFDEVMNSPYPTYFDREIL